MNTSRLNVILLNGHTDRSVRIISEEKPWALVIDVTAGRMARDGVLVELKTFMCRFALALVSRSGAIVSRQELTELLWGDREDGGPDRCDLLIRSRWLTVRMALTALGYGSEVHHRRGFRVWPVDRTEEDQASEDVIPRFIPDRMEAQA